MAALTKYDHSWHNRQFLTNDDICHYFMEHREGGYSASTDNQKIFNFKIPVEKKNTNQWYYKDESIRYFIEDLNRLGFSRGKYTIIPAPTSKPRSSPLFDNRLDQVLNGLQKLNKNITIEIPFDTINEYIPSHLGGGRNADNIKNNTQWIGFKNVPHPNVVLLDDVLTTGSHFRAYKDLILENDRRIQDVFGLFWALHI